MWFTLKKWKKTNDCNFRHREPIMEGCWRTSASNCCKSWRGSCGHRSLYWLTCPKLQPCKVWCFCPLCIDLAKILHQATGLIQLYEGLTWYQWFLQIDGDLLNSLVTTPKDYRLCRRLVCYTAVFSVVTQRSSPQTAAENRTTFLSLCVCGLTNKPIMYRRFDNAWAAGR